MEMINASGKVGIDVIMKLCQRVLDGKEMPEDWKTVVMYDGANRASYLLQFLIKSCGLSVPSPNLDDFVKSNLN